MPEKVLLIQHMADGCDDRVARHLSRRGFALEWLLALIDSHLLPER